MEERAARRPTFLSVTDKFVTAGTRVGMRLLAFPFKSGNKVYNVFGILPNKAEELAVGRLNNMCIHIGDMDSSGAQLTIIDGLVCHLLYFEPLGDVIFLH